MLRVKIFLLIASLAVSTSFSQDTESAEMEPTLLQKALLAKLTGHESVSVMTVFGNAERKVAREREVKLTDRSSVRSRKITANVLYRSLRKIGLKPLRHTYEAEAKRLDRTVEGTNLYAIIHATAKSDEYVLLGAHYDSVRNSPGANDNASGTALVFGVASQLAKLKTRTRNFIIVFFDQEEIGLVGSRAFARKLKSKEINLHSAHTVDQMGWDKDGDRAIELELPTLELEALYREEAKKLSIPVHKTNVPSTDHTAFREIGFNAIGITEEYKNKDTTPHYHRETDTYKTIDFDYLASSTKLVFNVMKRLADAR